jgi:hypothetical protein
MDQRGLWWSCVLLISVVAFGCGGDDDSGDAAGSGGAGGFSGGGAGGFGGAAGRAGGTGGAAGMMPPMPVPCGSMTCQPPQSPFAMFASLAPGLLPPPPVACCMNAATNACGVAPMTGGMCEARAMQDNRCAGINAGGMMIGGLGFGCCTSTNQCGVDGSAFGRGCVENSMAGTMLGPLSAIIQVPAAKTCDAPLPMGGAGAGGAGAGGGGAGGDEDAGTP